LNYLN